MLVAVGRRPNIADAGLDTVGLDPGARRSTPTSGCGPADRLWAIGDITGQGAFTHMSMYQADVALRDILGRAASRRTTTRVPRVTFTDPEVGSVGMTEEQAREAGLDVAVGCADVVGVDARLDPRAGRRGPRQARRGPRGRAPRGRDVRRSDGGEVLAMLATAVHARIPTSTLRTMPLAYPTFTRAVETALADLAE